MSNTFLLDFCFTCIYFLCLFIAILVNVNVMRNYETKLLLCPTVLPDRPDAGLEDERCPLMMGCDRAGGQCVCDARHSCLGSFTYPDQETCMKTSKSGELLLSICFYIKRHRCTYRSTIWVRGYNTIHREELIHNRCGSEVALAYHSDDTQAKHTHKLCVVVLRSPLSAAIVCESLVTVVCVSMAGFQMVGGMSTGKDTERSTWDRPTQSACSLGVTWLLRAVCASLRAATTTSPTSTAASAKKQQVTLKWPEIDKRTVGGQELDLAQVI